MTAPTTIHRIAPYLLLLSGFSALIYQIVWLRLLGLGIGVTALAVGVVIAAIFLGMALGAWLSTHLPRRLSGRLITFALVEAIVGIGALALLPLLLRLGELLALLPPWGHSSVFVFFITTLLLALPAAGLGAAYPLMAAASLSRHDDLPAGLGKLYGAHTLGAVAGVICAVFVLIPHWGLDGALYSAVIVNLLLAATTAYLARLSTPEPPVATIEESSVPPSRKLGLMVLCITGISASAVQIGWSKYLAIYTGSTLYGFALLLATVLLGIAAGSWLGARLSRRIRFQTFELALGLVLLALALLATRSALGLLPHLESALMAADFIPAIDPVVRYVAAATLLLPSALLYGILFPLALHYYCNAPAELAQRVGKGYATNTIAGVVGAALTGLWLLPTYGTDRLLWFAALLVSFAALPLALASQSAGRRTAGIAAAFAVIALASMLPKLDFKQLIANEDLRYRRYNSFAYSGDPNFLFLKEGHTGVISLVDYDGVTLLKNNSLNEAHLVLKQARTEILLGLLPQLLKPQASEVLVVGYGAGTTPKVLAAADKLQIRVVELEPAVLEAMTHHEGGQPQILRNPKVTLELDDARNLLLRETQQYDVILSQPSHSWRAGSGAMFSQEYFRIVHSRLNNGGLFGMWLNLFQMDRTTLRAVLKTFYREFPKGAVFINNTTAELLLFGSDEPLVLDYDQVAQTLQDPAIEPYARTINVATPHHILSNYFYFTSDIALQMAGEAPAITDLNLLAETRLAWMRLPLAPDEDPLGMLQAYIK